MSAPRKSGWHRVAQLQGVDKTLSSIVDILTAVASFGGLSGGFAFFVLMSTPEFGDDGVIPGTTVLVLFKSLLISTFAISYTGFLIDARKLRELFRTNGGLPTPE